MPNLKRIAAVISILIICLWEVDSLGEPVHARIFNGIPECTNGHNPPFIQLGEKYYFFQTEALVNWFEAVHICRSMSSNLASFLNEKEKNLVLQYLLEKNFVYSFWIAGNDLGKEGHFKWLSNGGNIAVNLWDNQEPNSTNSDENCVELTKRHDQLYHHMNDDSCTKSKQFICQADVAKVVLHIW